MCLLGRPAHRKSEPEQSRCNKMDLHQLPGSLYSFPQLYSFMARGLDQDPSSCSADDKMIEKLIFTLQDRTEDTPLYLYPQWAHASDICLTDASTCLCFQFLWYNAAVLARENAKSPRSDFFFWLNFAICKGLQIKTTIAYIWPVSSLVYKTISNGIHWVGTRRIWCQFSKYGQ